ncbi:MAG: hypothetical protein H0V24_18675 [Chloroflexia bacterium]|nr:hypothetical protein [Chloroflexia bacterium]
MPTLPETVRASCRAVADAAQHVRINHDRLAAYAALLSGDGLPTPTYDLAYHFRGSPADTIAFVLTLDSINFGSGYFPHLKKRPGHSGYFTIAAALTDRFNASGPFSAAELSVLTRSDCAVLFAQHQDNPVAMELMGHFACALNDLGHFVGEQFGSDYAAVVATADGSAARLSESLTAMPYFQDVARHGDRDVAFYKRAQITVADLALAFDRQGPGHFPDLDQLTMFADNLVPHVLHIDGVLAYDPALAATIDRGELISAGSPAEVEIRAVALDAVERLVTILQADGQQITAMDLDNLLWYRGGGAVYKERPRHRTRTVFY